jgi:hypothetical protein
LLKASLLRARASTNASLIMLALALLLGQTVASYQSALQAAAAPVPVPHHAMNMTVAASGGSATVSTCHEAETQLTHCISTSSQPSDLTERSCCDLEQAMHCAGGHCTPAAVVLVAARFVTPVRGDFSLPDIISALSVGYKTLPWQPPKLNRMRAV